MDGKAIVMNSILVELVFVIGFSANTEFSDLYDFYALKDYIIASSIVIKLCLNQRFTVHSTWNLWIFVMSGSVWR